MTDVAELGLKIHSDDVDKANRRLDQMKGSAGMAEAAIGKLTSAALKLVAAYASWRIAGAVMDKFVSATVEAERAQRRLETVVRSTGGAAGLTADELSRMAKSLQGVTTYSDEAIKSAQAVMLGYGRIGREVFPDAIKATLDMASALGMDLAQAAETVGKALDLPSRGMTSLADRGFFFTQQQIETARRLEETGKIAEAQKFVLDELAFAYGGAAQAARGTLGGALEALGHAFDDLFAVTGPASNTLREAVEDLIRTISDPDFIRSIHEMGAALFNAFNAALPVIIEIINRVSRFFLEMDARANDPQVKGWIESETGSREGAIDQLTKRLSRGGRNMAGVNSFGMTMEDFFAPFQPAPEGSPGAPAPIIVSKETTAELERQAKAYDQLVLSAQGRIDQLKLEAEATNLTAFEIARQEEYQRLLQATMKSGMELSPEQIAELEALSVAYADASLTVDGLHEQLQNRTPWEVAAEEIERLNELLGKGKIGWDDYAMGAGRAIEEMVGSYANGANDVLGNIEKLTDALGLQGKEAFEVQKMLGIARAVVSGGEAIVHSFNAGAAIGGPPVGFAFAGIAAAATAAQIAAIASSTYQSKTVPNATGGTAAPVSQPEPVAQQQTRTINLVLPEGKSHWSRAELETLVEDLNDAADDGLVIQTA